ncbi:tetratricopeptide repeat protein [Marinactinospora rubrisoli]|uniref:Tetratricopeptide repeat protein n=1 Tax=Marinactinospora rubrisoli TaxID=2715399 RepID=A0ABW2KAX6_9ACTN
MIETTAGGYLARVDPERVDLHRFRRLCVRARDSTDPEHAARLWGEALDCWRGDPFSGTGSENLHYTLGLPLLEEKWAAVAAWAEACFELGRYRDIVTRLTPLVRQDPLRESLHLPLIASLYRDGQRATALATFSEIQRTLADQLGIDPSRELMELHQRILRDTEPDGPPRRRPGARTRRPDGDPHGAGPGGPAAADRSTDPSVPPEETGGEAASFLPRNDLPRDIPDFTGRDADLERVLAIGATGGEQAEVCVITGPGGAGKTTLAIHAGHRLAERFPDGGLFVDLYGHTVDQEPISALSALGRLLRAVGVAPEAMPDTVAERAALWRAAIAGRRVLLLLDNARSFAQISPLLPASPGSLTVITSRHELSGLSGAHHVSLGMLDSGASVSLLGAVLGQERTAREPQAVRAVARLCGGLPLALRIVAGRMLTRPRWTFAHVEQRLGEQHRRFQELRTDGQSVEAIFELSYQSLTDPQRDAFLRLGLMIGGSIDLYGAAALLDVDLPGADDLLQELVSVCLLEEQGVDIYRFHDLIGAYARQQALKHLPAEDVDVIRHRAGDHYLHTAQRAAEWLGSRGHDYEVDPTTTSRYRADLSNWSEAIAWFDVNRENLAAVVDYYAGQGNGKQAWQLAHSLWRFYAVHGQTELWLSTHERALEASRADRDDMGSAVTLIGLGIAHCLSGRFEFALSLLSEARSIFARLGDRTGEIRAIANLAMVYERMGRFRDALAALDEVLEHAVAIGDRELEKRQRSNIAAIDQALGRFEEARKHCEAVLALRISDHPDDCHAAALRILGEINAQSGDLTTALEQLHGALAVFRDLGDQSGETYTRNNIGVVLRELGRIDEAVQAHQTALELGRETAQRSAEAEVLNELAVTHARAGRYPQARSAHDSALRLARERHERYAEARALHGLAQLPAEVVDPDDAAMMLAAATKIFAELGVPETPGPASVRE